MDVTVSGLRPVTRVEVDLIGDGREPVRYEPTDARGPWALWYLPNRVGLFGLEVRVADDLGCGDQTGRVRLVTVTP